VHAILDQTLAAFGLEAVLRDLILPTLRRVGVGKQQLTVAISQEHFASNLIRGRLLSLARLWGRGSGPLALLACAPGEQHDITVLSFGLLLRSYGWRILFLGADTPIATLSEAAETTRPALTVLASFDQDLLETEASALRRSSEASPARPQRPRGIRRILHPARRTKLRRGPHTSRHRNRTHHT
jgi:hypothetical protein